MVQGDGHTALTLAALRGHIGIVNILLAKGADIEATSKVMSVI